MRENKNGDVEWIDGITCSNCSELRGEFAGVPKFVASEKALK
jgi:hypothetical protein